MNGDSGNKNQDKVLGQS